METTVLNTWKPPIAGTLNIVSGVLGAFGAIAFTTALVASSTWHFVLDTVPPKDFPFVAPLVSAILITCLVFSIIEAVFPIIGGVFALQRKRWGWALAGSIVSIFGTLPLGIASTVLVAMAKDEFEP